MPIPINSVQRGTCDEGSLKIRFCIAFFFRDTALNLAVHRQKYHIVDLLLQYRANPNIFNQSGKTALHRAVASYIDENANQIRALFQVSQHRSLRFLWWVTADRMRVWTARLSINHPALTEVRRRAVIVATLKWRMLLRVIRAHFNPLRLVLIQPSKIEINEYLWMKRSSLINQVCPISGFAARLAYLCFRNSWHSAVSWSEFKRESLSSIDHRCSSRSRWMSEDLARRRYGSEHHRSNSHHSITRGVCRWTWWRRHCAR